MVISILIDPTQCHDQHHVFVAMDKDYADYIKPVELIAALNQYSEELKTAMCVKMVEKYGQPLTPEDDALFLERAKDFTMSDLMPPTNKNIYKL